VRNLLRRWFLENVALKTVALVLAVTLFILVRGEKETERSVKVRLAYVKPDDRVLVTDVPQTVDVWVRGPWTRIKRLDTEDIDPVVLDLTKVGDGDLTIEESAIRLPVGLHVVSIRPSKITVQFEYQKRVPIAPEIVGAPADGYLVRSTVVDPPAVTVRGTKTYIDGLVDLRTLPISVAARRSPFLVRAKLAPVPKGAAADVESVGVTVEVEDEVAQKTLPALPIQLQPPAGVKSALAITSYGVNPPTVEVVLRGSKNAIKQVDDKKVMAIVELHIEDLTPAAARVAPVLVRGTPPGVAIEVHPSEITLAMKPAVAPARQP